MILIYRWRILNSLELSNLPKETHLVRESNMVMLKFGGFYSFLGFSIRQGVMITTLNEHGYNLNLG